MLRISFVLALLVALAFPRAAFAQTATPTPTPTPTGIYDALIPVGMVQAFAGSNPPDGWLVADGQCLNKTIYYRLYAAIGNSYGQCALNPPGVGFALPDLRGRVIVAAGYGGSGMTNRIAGQTFGEENHTLTADEMPAHTHTIPGSKGTTTTGTAIGAQQYIQTYTTTSSSAGAGAAHNNMQPSFVLNYIIWSGTEILPISGAIEITPDGPTPTPSPTLSPTPNLYAIWTLEPESTDEPGQAVALKFEMTAGGVVNALLLFALLCSIMVMVALALFKKMVTK